MILRSSENVTNVLKAQVKQVMILSQTLEQLFVRFRFNSSIDPFLIGGGGTGNY